jgi:hypothetical protein
VGWRFSGRDPGVCRWPQTRFYLDWATAIDEILSLKEAPPDKQVSLITIRFRDRAAAWWQSYRYRRYLDGLPLLNGWRELNDQGVFAIKFSSNTIPAATMADTRIQKSPATSYESHQSNLWPVTYTASDQPSMMRFRCIPLRTWQ